MRSSSGCSAQLELVEDAAAVMRQAVSLAWRWVHAPVTTLHVASAMLSDAGGLFRAACLGSRASSHPLHCKALELCFNVALNSLATGGGPARPAMFQFPGDHAGHRAPALSNALAAAFKRVRDGWARRHVATKVNLKQLVISILDDPSVSRVMSEAGFSSAEVQANVKKQAISPSKESQAKAELVLDYMASGTNRCVVVLGESAAAAEEVVKAVMDKVSKGELRRQHERLKNAQFVPFSAASFQRMPREEVEASSRDICAFVRERCATGKGVVLVLEDLGYAAEAWTTASRKRNDHRAHAGSLDFYCPVGHAVAELSSLVRGKEMIWLLGFGAYASGQPSLETVLELHHIVVPDGSLALNHGGQSSGIPSCGDRRHHGPMAESYDQQSLADPNTGYSNWLSESNTMDGAAVRRRPKFTELTAENLKILCTTLEMRIPRHRDIALGIASAVLQRRSGVTRMTRPTSATWLIFQGRDNDGKMAMARELARLVFGSYAEFTCIAVAAATKLTPSHSADSSTGHHSLKRQRSYDEHGSCMQMFYEAIRENPHRVVLIDGVEQDSKLEAAIMNAMASGAVRGCYGGPVSLEDCIVVCSDDAAFESRSRKASSPRPVKQRIMNNVVDGKVKEDDGRAEKGRQVVPHCICLGLDACAIDVEGEEGSSSRNAVEILSAVDGVFVFKYCL